MNCWIAGFEELNERKTLAHQMFSHRRVQFLERKKWALKSNEVGEERDQYDNCESTYLILFGNDEKHLASLRLREMANPTMIAEFFPHLLPSSVEISRGDLECTRLCLSPNLAKSDARRAVRQLMIQSCNYGLSMYARHAFGIFEESMLRVYKLIGWEPTVIATCAGGLASGKWIVSTSAKSAMEMKQNSRLANDYRFLQNGATKVAS